MSTISVPLTPELEKSLIQIVAETGLSKADIMRSALDYYAEEVAVNNVLAAQQEHKDGKLLRGDLESILG